MQINRIAGNCLIKIEVVPQTRPTPTTPSNTRSTPLPAAILPPERPLERGPETGTLILAGRSKETGAGYPQLRKRGLDLVDSHRRVQRDGGGASRQCERRLEITQHDWSPEPVTATKEIARRDAIDSSA